MGGVVRIEFKWPDKRNTPHAKGHWRTRAKGTKVDRYAAFVVAKAAKVRRDPFARIKVSYAPPNDIRRDPHNMPSRCKAIIDGIASAMGCDDRNFWIEYAPDFLPKEKGGKVIVEIETEDQE